MAGPTYEEKRAELRATAEGGMAGRQAYREGRERLVSDQRAAIDAALAGPVRFGEGTASALENIIRPVGDSALARIDHAGERHGSSMGELDTYLNTALAQQGGARQLNYDTRLADSRQATDRNISLSEISRRKAEEAEAARQAQARANQDQILGELSKWKQEALAEGLGEGLQADALAQEQALQTPEMKRELARISGRAFSHIQDPKERQALLSQVINATSTDEILALVDQYAPKAKDEFGSLLGGITRTIGQVGNAVTNQPTGGRFDAISDLVGTLGTTVRTGRPDPAAGRNEAIEALLGGAADLGADQQGRLRDIEANRYLYNRDAYIGLGGDPLMAAGLFPEDFDSVGDTLDDRFMADFYRQTGLPPSQYDEWRAEQEELGTYDDTLAKFDIATGAATNPAIVSGAAKDFGIDEVDLYANLEPGMAGHEVVTTTLARAAEDLDAGAMPDDVIIQAVTSARADAEAQGLQRGYADALARIVAEQLAIYAEG